MFGSPRLGACLLVVLFAAAGTAASPLVPDYYLFLANTLMIYAVLALGLDLLMGWSGQFAFAQMAFFGVGCYTTALLKQRLGVPFLVGMPLGALAAAAIGLLVAFPATRLRSIYLALATFAFAEGARWLYGSWDSLTGGSNGLRLPVMTVFGVEIIGDRQAFPVIAVLTALVVLATMMITSSRFGREMVAVRESEHVAMASGIDVRRVKVESFAISALYAGLAGGMYALNHSFVTPAEFGFEGAVLVLSMLVVGGMGSIPGVLIGVVLIGLLPVLLQTALRSLQLWQELVYGLILTLAVMFMPRGVWGAVGALVERRRPARAAVAATAAAPTEERRA